MGQATVWTVGHSTHELPAFLTLLRGQGLEVIADVRSQPFSRRNPQFNRDNLRLAILEAGIQYVYLGLELGGRPPEPELYDNDGHVLYGGVARTKRFHSGIQRLQNGIDRFRVALLCSEEDPTDCHRRLLVSKVLAERGIAVVHLRGDGSVVHEKEFGRLPVDTSQCSLFGQEVSAWRSIRSVSPSTPRRSSSRPYNERV
jgi:uncharacterized protein (DUF488 family)